MTERTVGLPDEQQSPSYWRTVWRHCRRNRRGMGGLVFVTLMVVVASLSPLLATNQPILCRYKGQWYLPAIVPAEKDRKSTRLNSSHTR